MPSRLHWSFMALMAGALVGCKHAQPTPSAAQTFAPPLPTILATLCKQQLDSRPQVKESLSVMGSEACAQVGRLNLRRTPLDSLEFPLVRARNREDRQVDQSLGGRIFRPIGHRVCCALGLAARLVVRGLECAAASDQGFDFCEML